MRPALLCLMFCSTVVRPTEGSRLGRLEDEVKLLKTFIFRELSIIRDDVKEVSNRVEMLENATVTHDPSFLNQDMDITSHSIGDITGKIGKQLVRDGKNEAINVVKAGVQHMRKAYANDKQDLHQMKQDIKGQLKELEEKIISHMHKLTADVKHNIEYIHQNISLAKNTLSEFINGSSTNLSFFSDTFKNEIKYFFTNTSEQLALRFNETDTAMKHNLSSTYRTNEIELENIMSLAIRNVSEIILKAENLVSIIRSNISEMPTQITHLSQELETVKVEIDSVDINLSNTLNFIVSSVVKCGDDFIWNDMKYVTIKNSYFYPCAKDIRLANASHYGFTGVKGRLEVRHDNTWGTVCDDSFQDEQVGEPYITNNVNVVCRLFGFRECHYVVQAGLGRGSGVTWMDDVECGGGESSFLDCNHPGWGVENCNHFEDVGFRMWN